MSLYRLILFCNKGGYKMAYREIQIKDVECTKQSTGIRKASKESQDSTTIISIYFKSIFIKNRNAIYQP